MPNSPGANIFCPANHWTQVEWYTGTLFLSKRYTVGPGIFTRWRYFSSGIPPYWEGSFTGSAVITLPAGIYVSLEFNPSTGTPVIATIA